MAIDQRQALIDAVRAQVEKEKAAKAAKLKKEQEAMRLSGQSASGKESNDNNKPKYKTLSAEELARIEEKKRRKKAAELGITLEDEEKVTETSTEQKVDNDEGLGMSVGIQPDKSGKSLDNPTESSAQTLGGAGKTEGLGLNLDGDKKNKSQKADSDDKARLQPIKLSGSDGDVKVIGGEEEKEASVFKKEGNTTIISDGADWKATESSTKKSDEDDINIVPNRTTPTNDVKSMYDLGDEDEDKLGAEINKLAGFEDASKKDDSTAKKTENEQAEAAKKAAEAEAARKKAALEEAQKKEEARRNKLKEAEKKAAEQERRIAEAAAKKKAVEEAKKRAAEEAAKKAEEEEKRKKAEEARKQAAEEARKKAEADARNKAKEEALKKLELAKKAATDAKKAMDDATKAETDARRLADESKKKAEEAAKKVAEVEAKKKAEEVAAKKAQDEKIKAIETEIKKAIDEISIAKSEAEIKSKATVDKAKQAVEVAKNQAEDAKKQIADAENKVKSAQQKVSDNENKVKAAEKALEEAKKSVEEAKKNVETSKAEVETAKKAEQEKSKAVEMATKKVDEETKKAEELVKKAVEEATKKKTEAEKKKTAAEAEAKSAIEAVTKKAEAEADAKKAEEASAKKAEADAKKAVEAAAKKAEEAKKNMDAAKQAEMDAQKEVEQADSIKLDLTMPAETGKLPLAAAYLEKYTKLEKSASVIVDTFNAIAADTSNRNIIFMGEHGFGLTCIGEDFARSFYDMGICKAKTIAKIKAQALNKVKLTDAMKKLAGGTLVVENAGLIAPDRFKELMKLTSQDVNDIVVIFTGSKDSLNRLLEGSKSEAEKFIYSIDMLEISNADMISIANGYFAQQGYKVDDSVEGTVKNMLLAMESGNIDRMLKAIDDAMLKCEEREKAKNINKKILSSEDFK